MNPLEELFLDQLADIYDAEKRIAKALPKLAKNATSEELQAAFEQHTEETKQQIARLEDVFAAFDKKPKGKPCKGTMGLLEEADEVISEHGGTTAGDAGLIAAAQKVEHYEIASYGCLIEWAKLLGKKEAVSALKETLNEEEETDEKLSALAEESINQLAAASNEEEEEEAPAPKAKKKSKK